MLSGWQFLRRVLGLAVLGFCCSGFAQSVYEYQVERVEYCTQATTIRPASALDHDLFGHLESMTATSVRAVNFSGPGVPALLLAPDGTTNFNLLDDDGNYLVLNQAALRGNY